MMAFILLARFGWRKLPSAAATPPDDFECREIFCLFIYSPEEIFFFLAGDCK